MRAAAVLLFLLCAAACAQIPRPASDPMLYDPAHWAGTEHVIIGIPGALSPVAVISKLDRLNGGRRAVGYYRLPGFDKRPAEEFVNLDYAAQRIADAVAESGAPRADLVGHSTGAAIALEAAKIIRTQSPEVLVRVTGISTALPAPQPALAGARGAAGTVAAAARAGSLNPRDVWLEYYRTLAYGPGAGSDPVTAEAADDLVAANEGRIDIPSDGLAHRHWRALRRWTNPHPERLAGVEVVLYHGAVDPVFPPRAVDRFARTLPQAELRLIDGHGHLLMLTYPEIWSRIAQDIAR